MITNLKTDLRSRRSRLAPIGIGERRPRLSWQYSSDERGDAQAAYIVEILQGGTVFWSSGEVACDRCTVYPECDLSPLSKYSWRVSVLNSFGRWETSEEEHFSTGFFSLEDWRAGFITCKGVNGDPYHPEPIHARMEFEVKRGARVESAFLYTASTTGVYASISGPLSTLTDANNQYLAYLNGIAVTDERLNPGQITSEGWPAAYRTFDVTEMLHEGRNVLGAVTVAMAYSAYLRIEYADGTASEVDFSDSRSIGKGPLSLWIDGMEEHGGKCEKYLAPYEFHGWLSAGYDDSLWQKSIKTDVVGSLCEQKVITYVDKTVSPVSLRKCGECRYIADFGENLHGNLNLAIKVPKYRRGIWVKIRHAESLTADGELDPNSHINQPHGETDGQTDLYLTNAHSEPTVEYYTPRFSLHGFRYAEISGIKDLSPRDVSANSVVSSVESESEFVCSSEGINELYRLCRRTERCNLISIPTDCPHRERLGWLADALSAADGELLEWNLQAFYESWFASIRAEQNENGRVPYASPTSNQFPRTGCDIVWMTAAAEIPYLSYLRWGDDKILRDNYEMIERMIGYIEGLTDARGIPLNATIFGDHTAPKNMNKDYLSALYYYRILDIAQRISEILGVPADYGGRLARLKIAINEEFYKNGSYSDDLTADISHSLYFEIAEEGERQALAKRLAEKISATKTMMAGTLGVRTIIPTLARYGYNDKVLELAEADCDGSFGGWIKNYGATTAFEHLLCDGIYNKNSIYHCTMNHVFLVGSIHAWLYRSLAGIEPLSPGYKSFSVSPYIPDGLDFVSAKLETAYGAVATSWKKQDGELILDISVPCGTSAEVSLLGEAYSLTSGKHTLSVPYPQNS